jgi:hypothetical protein
MSKSAHLHPSDIRGASRLVVDAIIGIAHVVEAMHGNIAHLPGLPRPAVGASARGITGLVYRSVRQIAGGVGQILDAALARLVPLLGPNDTAPLARLGKIRSAGITDLRYGNLVDEDWEGRDRFAGDGDRRRAIPLPEGVACYAIAGTSARSMGGIWARRSSATGW